MSDERLIRLFEEGGGKLADAQLNAAVFMLGYDFVWDDLRRFEADGRVKRIDDRWHLLSERSSE
jgi:hypothetical protein